ncbi:MAG TPA: TonB family protein [Acidobacteriaceae bacterium]|nr:TonB family protein [Acidobacteriaceae bacterium]
MTEDLLNRANLGLLPDQKGRFGSFGVSLAVNLAIAGFAVLLSVAGVHEVKQKVNTSILIFPTQPPPEIQPPVPRVHVIPPPPKMAAPKIEMPKPRAIVEPPKPVEMKMPEQAPRMDPAPPLRVTPPPQPKVGLFTSAHPTMVANNMQRPTPKTGGFGDPQGVHPNPNATRTPTIAAAGSFSGTPGIGSPGAGAARRGSVHGTDFGSGVANGVPGGKDTHGTVASAGFSNGVIGGTGKPGSRGHVAQGGFGGPNYAQGAAPARTQEVAHTTPLVLLSKPNPGYTEEARRLRIEGDVTLEVRFSANGQVEVLRVVNGLGHGLNELAEQAARRITFKPATRDGRAIDEVTLIHVTFQLA